jgi:hypothetical protein
VRPPDEDVELIVEVKRRKPSKGYNLEEWPFDDVIVDNLDKYNQKEIKPWQYVCVSHTLRYALSIKHSTRDQWSEMTNWSRTERRNKIWLVAPKHLWQAHYFSDGIYEDAKRRYMAENPGVKFC